MASTNVNLSEEAYSALAAAKRPGQSFSEVILEYVKPPARTCGELLDQLEKDFLGVKLTDPLRMKKVIEGRGRRSNRPKRA